MKIDLYKVSIVAAACFVFHETNGSIAGEITFCLLIAFSGIVDLL